MIARHRLAAAGFAVAVGLTSFGLAPAVAAPAPLPAALLLPAAAQCTDAAAATSAADYVATQWTADPSQFSRGGLADAIIGLAAVGTHGAELEAMVAKLKTEAPDYAVNGGAAGKVAIAAMAAGEDPTNFGGVNLVKAIQDALADDPLAGGTFNTPWAVVALARHGDAIPQATVDAILAAQDKTTGAFGYSFGGSFNVDPDSTGLLWVALEMLNKSQPSPAITDAITKVKAWADGAVTAEGYWDNYSPVNTTAMVMQGYTAHGATSAKAMSWLVGQQMPDGGMPNTLEDPESNLMATTQALPALDGLTIATVTFEPCSTEAPSSAAPTSAAPTSATPTSAAPSSDAPSSATSSMPGSTEGAPQKPSSLPKTGADGAAVRLFR